MKKEFIKELFKKFESACYDCEGLECWISRDLQEILGYALSRNFKNVIDKAKKFYEQVGKANKNHFAKFSKMVEIRSGAQKLIEDIALIRYACYLRHEVLNYAIYF
jgi:DNA-damage-inducible protein D